MTYEGGCHPIGLSVDKLGEGAGAFRFVVFEASVLFNSLGGIVDVVGTFGEGFSHSNLEYK